MTDAKKSPQTATAKATAPAKTSPKSTTARFSPEERDAMKQRAKELKTEARASHHREEGEWAVRAKIAEMAGPDRAMAERIHEIIRANAPALSPRLWYGMPSYAKDGKILCFFQDAQKFNSRYATFGFSDVADLDDGAMWPTSYALTKVTAAEEKRIAALVKQAAS